MMAAGPTDPLPTEPARPVGRRGALRRYLRQPACQEGMRDMAGVALATAAWGLVTGVAMVKSGLAVYQAVLMSVLVFAGTAQLAALPLLTAGAPMWVVWATTACLNLRFVIFSAQWRPYFAHLPQRQRALLAYFATDLNFVLFMKRFPEPRPEPAQQPYYWGGVLVNAGAWHVASLIGIFAAHRVPTDWGLDFAGTVALLGMTASLLVDRATWMAAAVAGIAAMVAYGLPLRLHIMVAIAAAVAAGLVIERHRALRQP